MSDELMKGCVVTGVAGFVGSHLAERLLSLGCFVVGVDNFSSGRAENMEPFRNHDRFAFYECDVQEEGLLSRLKERHSQLCYCFHLAAIVSVPFSMDHPDETMAINWRATSVLVQEAERLGFERFVFAGSAAEYGDDQRLPLLEEYASEETTHLSPYGRAKFLASKDVASTGCGVALRCFNIYGPRQDPRSPYSGVISRFIEMGLAGKSLTVFGDGEQTRDFIYVGDVVEAYVYASGVNGTANRTGGDIFNVGTGEKTSVKELAETLRDLTDNSEEIVYLPERPGDIRHSTASIAEIRKKTGWEPSVSLREGLKRTVRWYGQAGTKE